MTLRRKLLTLLAALALTALLSAGVSVWAASAQQRSHQELEAQLMRSLLLQRIDATGRVLLRGQFAAVISEAPGARDRFDTLDERMRADLNEWAEMPMSEEQAVLREAVRRVYGSLVAEIHEAFDALDRGDPETALERLLAYDRRRAASEFADATNEASEAHERERATIRAMVERTRETVQIALVVAAVALLSLILLFVAYLGGEIFRPLSDLREALEAVAGGDRAQRLEEGRDDELGAVSRAFNRMMEAMEEASDEETSRTTAGNGAAPAVTLSRGLATLRATLPGLADSDPEARATHRARMERVLEGLEGLGGVAAPSQLALGPASVASVMHDGLRHFLTELGQRSVGVEVAIEAGVDEAIFDRDKLGVAVGELIRAALISLPARGGRIGLRARADEDDEDFWVLEIADDGPSPDPARYERALERVDDPADAAEPALHYALEVIVAHEAEVRIDAEVGRGTLISLRLPGALPGLS